eukprot:5269280-Prymnesium_polylepis.1
MITNFFIGPALDFFSNVFYTAVLLWFAKLLQSRVEKRRQAAGPQVGQTVLTATPEVATCSEAVVHLASPKQLTLPRASRESCCRIVPNKASHENWHEQYRWLSTAETAALADSCTTKE